MSKTIALFLDGTWNTVKTRTNVRQLYELARLADPARQLAYYEPGIGTRPFGWLLGGALGYGLGGNVIAAYRFLVETYEDGDAVFVFGFSRGAYTARSLTGLIAKCGLLHRAAAPRIAEIYDRYRRSAEMRPISALSRLQSRGRPLTDAERSLLIISRRIPIRFIGVWDTVGALGIPFGDIPGLSRRESQFRHTRLGNLFEHAYQALAIDEHREAFQPTLWTSFRPKTPDPVADDAGPGPEPMVEQRWFVGAHGDVGGGCRTSLATLALDWLARKAVSAGLALSTLAPPDALACRGRITDSYAAFMFGGYRLLKLNRRYYRTVGADPVDKRAGWVSTVNEVIDGSVFDRLRADPGYRPPALLAWAARHNVEPAELRGPIDAAAPRSRQRATRWATGPLPAPALAAIGAQAKDHPPIA